MTQDTKATSPRQRRRPPTTSAASFTFCVVEGPDRGERFTIRPNHPSRVLIGKSTACDLRLKDDAISRRHLAAEVSGSGLRITDLESTNGTRVGGVQFVEIIANGGEVLQLGDTRIAVERAPEITAVPLPAATNFGRLVGASEAMRKLYPLCRKLAASDVSVVIEGETGTGKEVLAEAIHEASDRADKPFVVFDCTTIPANLIESALFGHVRGAFTGATESRAGVFEQADGGSLLLDEIGDLGLDLQAKLLRALQRSEVQPVGSNRWLKVDVRIIAATRRDLDAEVQAGRFRDDLFYRLAVTRIELPPLRRRGQDVSNLVRHFYRAMANPGDEPDDALLERFESYGWPGNVRELQNAVARHIALGDLALGDLAFGDLALGDRAGMAAMPAQRASAPPGAPDDVIAAILAEELPFPRARRKVQQAFEQRYLTRVLNQHEGNVARAAAASGVARRYFRLLRARNRDPRDEQ